MNPIEARSRLSDHSGGRIEFPELLPFLQKRDMNSHFLSAVAPYIKQEVLTHQQQVCRLYKHSLKCLMSWSTNRDIFMEQATILRKRFRDNANLDPNSA